MHLSKATNIAVEHFEPHHDDFMEALAAGVNWKKNLEDAVRTGEVVMIQPFDADMGCQYFPMAFGGNIKDQVWFVTSSDSEHWTPSGKLRFHKLIVEHRDMLLETYPVLWNYVWIHNKSHMRFLKSIGAEFHEDYQESPTTGERFQLFTIRRQNGDAQGV